MNKERFTIDYETFEALNELSAAEQALCLKAEEALRSSHSPYSGFRVGTALSLENGTVVLGSNQENVAYPSGLCAERVALFSVGAHHPSAVITTMAITAKTDHFKIEKPVTSCGACLQVMAEYEKKQGHPITVLFYCMGGQVIRVKGIPSLLPFAFVEDRLKA